MEKLNLFRQILKGIASALTVFPEAPKISLQSDKKALESDYRNIQEDFSKVMNENYNLEKQWADKILRDFSVENFSKLRFYPFFSGCGSIDYTNGDKYCIGFYKALGDSLPEICQAFNKDVRTFEQQLPHKSDVFWVTESHNEKRIISFKDRELTMKLRNRFYLLYRMHESKMENSRNQVIIESSVPELGYEH